MMSFNINIKCKECGNYQTFTARKPPNRLRRTYWVRCRHVDFVTKKKCNAKLYERKRVPTKDISKIIDGVKEE